MPTYKEVPKGELYDNPNYNKGKLLRGNLGNKGGNANSGRPPEEIRVKCRQSFFERVHRAEEIIDNPTSKPGDVLDGLDLLGKYGGLQRIDQTSGDEPVKVLYINPDAI